MPPQWGFDFHPNPNPDDRKCSKIATWTPVSPVFIKNRHFSLFLRLLSHREALLNAFSSQIIVFSSVLIAFSIVLNVFSSQIIVFSSVMIVFSSQLIAFGSQLIAFGSLLNRFSRQLNAFSSVLNVCLRQFIAFSCQLKAFSRPLIGFSCRKTSLPVMAAEAKSVLRDVEAAFGIAQSGVSTGISRFFDGFRQIRPCRRLVRSVSPGKKKPRRFTKSRRVNRPPSVPFSPCSPQLTSAPRKKRRGQPRRFEYSKSGRGFRPDDYSDLTCFTIAAASMPNAAMSSSALPERGRPFTASLCTLMPSQESSPATASPRPPSG